MKFKKLWLLSILVLGLVLAACGAEGGEEFSLDGTAWQLSTYRKNAPLAGTNPTLAFADGQVSGNASCNSYGGGVQVDGQQISFGALFSTEMACMDPAGVMEQETDYLQMLMQVNQYEIQDGNLVLFFGDHETLVFTPVN